MKTVVVVVSSFVGAWIATSLALVVYLMYSSDPEGSKSDLQV